MAIDNLITEEVATLPLLPRKLTDQELRQHQQIQENEMKKGADNAKPPLTGEQKLIATLRKAYKKNIDSAEAYCNRNIFTVQGYSKTKRRMILEQYFSENGNDADDARKEGQANEGNPIAGEFTASATALASLPDGVELPSPEIIRGMDKEILVTRQRIQYAKQRRTQQARQLERLEKANHLLVGVLEALQIIENLDSTTANDDDERTVTSLMQSLKQSVINAMEGHEELKIWNVRAEEVLQILDKIKVDREEFRGGNHRRNGKKSALSGSNGGATKVVVADREEDERRRNSTLQEIGASLGTKDQVASLLNKLRGN